MGNTYKKVYLHIVFAVKNKNALLDKAWRQDVFSYISGVINNKGHYSLAVNGYHDHIHILIDYSLQELIPDLVREIKKASSTYIKEQNLSPFHFEWQVGYGVFSVGWKEKLTVLNYIVNQEKHHATRSFKEEYLAILAAYEVEFKDEYLFDFLD